MQVPLRRDGRPDLRFGGANKFEIDWNRSAACKRCGRSDLYWGKNPAGAYRLFNVSEQLHTCNGNNVPTPTPVQDLGDQELYKLDLEMAKRQINDKVAQVLTNLAQVHGAAKEDLKQTALEVAKLLNQAVAEAIKNQLPVVHVHVVEKDGVQVALDASAHYLTPLLLRFIAAGANTFLVGPAGSGKTMAGAVVAKALGLKFYPKAMSISDDAWTLVGHLSPVTGEYVPGVLYEPFKNGGMFFLDEVGCADPSAMVTLNAALANGWYMFPNGELVQQHKDFVCVAADNTWGRGANNVYGARNPLDGATLDRFAFIEWDYDEAAEAVWAGATPRKQNVLNLEDGMAVTPDEWLNFTQAVRHSLVTHKLTAYIVSPRASIVGVKLFRQGVPVKYVLDALIWKGMPVGDRDRVLNTASNELSGMRLDLRQALGVR